MLGANFVLCEWALNKHARLKHAPGMFSQNSLCAIMHCVCCFVRALSLHYICYLGPSESCRYTSDNSFRLEVEEEIEQRSVAVKGHDLRQGLAVQGAKNCLQHSYSPCLMILIWYPTKWVYDVL